jgi:AraC-like DNA-binding protein
MTRGKAVASRVAQRFDRTHVSGRVRLVHAHRDRSSTGEHSHDDAMLFVPLAGALRFTVAGRAMVADVHHALVVRARVPHRHAPTERVEYFVAYVDDDLLARRGAPAGASRFANTALVRELAGELFALARADDRELVQAATQLLCAQAVRRAPPPLELDPDDPRLVRAIELARARYRERVSTAELARAAGLSARAFERTLLRACGLTPRRLVEELRLADAKAQLASGRESVTEIALALGYRSLSHFIRRYRRAFGETPAAARRR